MPAFAVDLTDLTGDDAPPRQVAMRPSSAMATRTISGGAARGGDVIELLDSDSDSEPNPLEDRRPRKRPAPAGKSAAGRRPQQAPTKTRGVIDLSGERMKVTVELGTGAAAASRAPASLSGGTSQAGGNGNREDDMWKCSICLDEMVNPASTTCGHLFCEECIKQCLKTAKTCPQCRKRLTAKTAYHRIYLPPGRPSGGGPPDDAFPAC